MRTSDSVTEYWEQRWQGAQTGWDIGYASTPIVSYFDQVAHKDQKILIPGCGNAWEGAYLFGEGFKQTHLIDIAPTAVKQIRDRIPDLPEHQLILGDFFDLDDAFDIVVEQTFFCALEPERRMEYATKMHELLRPGGKLVGVMFDTDFGNPHPPYGGTKEEYLSYFEPLFKVRTMERCHNSIPPRQGHELFVLLERD